MKTNKLYGIRDMVKIASNRCAGCGACCRGMGDSIHLDPYDIYTITKTTGKTFRQMLDHEIELRVDQGLFLPNIRMVPTAFAAQAARLGLPPQEACSFLDASGKCSIHQTRPGFCRLFPLGRQYEDGKLYYFEIPDGCNEPGKKTVRIGQYLGIDNYEAYEAFTIKWHYFTKNMQERAMEILKEETGTVDESKAVESPVLQQLNTFIIQAFFDKAYDPNQDFYTQFEERFERVQSMFI